MAYYVRQSEYGPIRWNPAAEGGTDADAASAVSEITGVVDVTNSSDVEVTEEEAAQIREKYDSLTSA